jgi:hypothetical protein
MLSVCATGLCTLKTIASQYEHFESTGINQVRLQLKKASVTLSLRSGKIEFCSRQVLVQNAA